MRLSAVFLPPDLSKKKVNEGVRLFFFFVYVLSHPMPSVYKRDSIKNTMDRFALGAHPPPISSTERAELYRGIKHLARHSELKALSERLQTLEQRFQALETSTQDKLGQLQRELQEQSQRHSASLDNLKNNIDSLSALMDSIMH